MSSSLSLGGLGNGCLAKHPPHQNALDDGLPALALVVHHLNVVQVGVSPVDEAADQVQRDAVRKHDLAIDQLGAVLPIHVTALHLWDLPIVREEHLPVGKGHVNWVPDIGDSPFHHSLGLPLSPHGRVQCNALGVVELQVQQSDTCVPVSVADKDPIIDIIHKVEVARQPVDGHLFHVCKV